MHMYHGAPKMVREQLVEVLFYHVLIIMPDSKHLTTEHLISL